MDKKITQFDTTGKQIAEVNITNGNAPLVFKHFNGNTYIKGEYKNFYLNNLYEVYYFDGTLASTSNFRNGKRDGIYKSFYYGGVLESEGKYVDGYRDGIWKFFYENGKLNYEEQFEKGQQTGKEMIYNEDGTKAKEYSYKDGNLNGEYKIYGEDNHLAVVFNYKDGVLISYTYEGKDGKLVTPIALKNATGLVTAYYSNGNKSVEINFLDNEINGNRIIYFTNGKVYIQGERVLDKETGVKKFIIPTVKSGLKRKVFLTKKMVWKPIGMLLANYSQKKTMLMEILMELASIMMKMVSLSR